MKFTPRPLLLALTSLCLAGSLFGRARTSPQEHFGFAIGDDYHLATFTQTEAYFRKLAEESDRVKWVDIGPTEEGRRQPMLIVTSPENHRNLARYQEISRRLARAEDLTDYEAQHLARAGRAVVWIDGGLHATETVATQQLIESVWRLASSDDPETRRILDEVIILFAHANPDGQELISSWYMRRPVPEQRVLDLAPRLYQKYAGHDNNRDFYMMNLKESTNINRQLFLEWIPQIVYNHHQSSPPGTIMVAPPYRDPFNYVYDPLIITGLDAIGAAMHNRFAVEDKPGLVMKRGSVFSTWWNGGLRTTVYFHNQIGVLTEVAGNPTPMEIALIPSRQVPSGDLPYPVPPQRWHFRQSIEYSLTANYAILNYAARYRDELLYNIYRMGKNSIERGRRDHWTLYPSRVEAMRRQHAEDPATTQKPATAQDPIPARYYEVLRKPEWRDPRGYVIPADQADFPTAVAFVNVLIKGGVAVHRARAPFTIGGRPYPEGSYVVKTDQAFRPHILDMFEPQDHPNDFVYPGGPPIPPYDMAGWTLAYQMGITFERVLDDFHGPFDRLPYGELQTPPPGKVGEGVGYLVSHRVNQSFVLANRLLKAGVEAYWLKEDLPGFGPGALYVPAQGEASAIVARAARELGIEAVGVKTPPAGEKLRLAPMRIALWDRYGGSMPSGWTRWLLEQFEFPFEVVYPPNIDAGNLRASYDELVRPPGAARGGGAWASWGGGPRAEDVPPPYRGWLGALSTEKSIPVLREFLEAGGTILAIGDSTRLANHLQLPLRNPLVEKREDGRTAALPREKYYVPGSILRARTDPQLPLAWGLSPTIDLFFNNSPVFALEEGAAARGLRPAVWFDSPEPLRSGWAWGQEHLENSIVALEASVGRGKLYLFGNEVAFRAQPHGTFKLLFNGLFLSTAR